MMAFACVFTPSLAQDKKMPSMAFLEYLADLEKVDGNWVDPLDFQLQQAELQRLKNNEKSQQMVERQKFQACLNNKEKSEHCDKVNAVDVEQSQ